MKIKKQHSQMFILVFTLGWFYSGATWVLLDIIGIIEYFNIERPWDLLIAFAIGHALTAAHAASEVYNN
jgi:hypothetical protein|tara:strand:- start:541 stop:747 length:207 start_codon:yes stop_codon:yes gene_type:complete